MAPSMDIEEGIGAQITVGNYRVQIGEHGAVVDVAPPGSQPAPRPLTAEQAPPASLDEGRTFDAATARQTLAPLPDEEKRLLSALAAVGGGPLEAGLLAALADVADPVPALEALLERKLIQAHRPRYSLTGDLDSLLPSIWDISPWSERALAYFLSWAEARREDAAALLAEEGALRHLLDWAARTGHHAETLRLGRALDTALVVSGRWGAWGQVLERVRGAAAAIGNRAAEAWALHQLGTRLLCLDDKAAARELLSHALALRKSLEDSAGAAVTRHNLALLGPPSYALPGRLGRYSIPYRLLPWLAIALLVLIVGGIRLLSSQMTARSPEGSESVVPISSDMGAPPESTPIPPAAIEESSDLTTEAAEPTPHLTSDQSADETEREPAPEVTDSAELPTEAPETEAPQPPAKPPDRQGWCCSGGEVSLSSEAECKGRRGGFFLRQRPAMAACLITGCCIDGTFKLGEKLQRCDELGGSFMAAIEVPLRCRAP